MQRFAMIRAVLCCFWEKKCSQTNLYIVWFSVDFYLFGLGSAARPIVFALMKWHVEKFITSTEPKSQPTLTLALPFLFPTHLFY